MPDYTLDLGTGVSANGTTTLTGATGPVNVAITTDTNTAGQTANVGNMGTPSAPALFVLAITDPITTTMTFDQPVENISFEIYDIDFSAGGWDDSLQIIATDANGNQIPISYSDLDGLHSIAGDTVNADGSFNDGVETFGAEDSVSVSIAGPITSLTFIFDNGESVANSGQFGIGNLSIDAAAPDYAVEGGNGDDTIGALFDTDPEGDQIDNNDALDGSNDDLVYGGSGNDTIQSGAGDDTVYGDAIFIDPADFPSGTEGAASSFTFVNASPIEVQLFQIDSAGVPQPGDVVAAGGTLVQTTTTDTNWLIQDPETGEFLELVGNPADGSTYTFDSDGNDSASGGAGNDTVYLEGGDDTFGDFSTEAGNDTVFGGAGNDLINGGEGNDSIYSGAGNDRINSGSGNDTVYGGTGDDTIGASIGADDIYGGDGNDTMSAGGFAGTGDLMDGGADNDTIIGGLGNDTMLGGTGDDTLITASTGGTDTIEGGENAGDTDTLNFTDSNGPDGVDVVMTGDEAGTYDFAGETGNGTFTEIEELSLTEQNDTFDGAAATSGSTLYGGAGEDSLFGGTGDDSVFGGIENDFIDGGFGTDVLDGGDGIDTVSYLQSFGNPTAETLDLDMEAGTALLNGVGNEIATNFENAITGDTTDTITGTSGTNEISSGGGNDVIDGAAGDDTLDAGAGNDTVTGGEGSDSIIGGSGDDTIVFAEGDTASGGSGDDVFVLQDLGETSNGTITITGGEGGETPDDGDPNTVEGDTLQLGTGADLSTLVQVSDGLNADGNESFSGSVTLDDGTILNFSEIENIICFTPGTRIATPQGLVAVEDLEVGDLVVTRDHGLQPIRWIEGRIVPAKDGFAPVRIRKNVLSGQDRDLVVSPQHRVLFQGYQAELLFGESEVLVSAKHLIDGLDVTQDEGDVVTYIHMLFDQHEIIYAEGAATESFHPADNGFSAVSDEARGELFAIFPELRVDPRQYGSTARRCLKDHEAKLVRF